FPDRSALRRRLVVLLPGRGAAEDPAANADPAGVDPFSVLEVSRPLAVDPLSPRSRLLSFGLCVLRSDRAPPDPGDLSLPFLAGGVERESALALAPVPCRRVGSR